MATAKSNVTAAAATFTVESKFYKFNNSEVADGTALLTATNGSDSTAEQEFLKVLFTFIYVNDKIYVKSKI